VTNLRLSPYRVDAIRHPGSQPADPPEQESFWTDSATGTSPTLTWRVTDGDYRIVVMNVDGSPGVVLQGQFGIKISGIRGFGIGALIIVSCLNPLEDFLNTWIVLFFGAALGAPQSPEGTPGRTRPLTAAVLSPASYPPPSSIRRRVHGEPPPYGGPPSIRRRRPPAKHHTEADVLSAAPAAPPRAPAALRRPPPPVRLGRRRTARDCLARDVAVQTATALQLSSTTRPLGVHSGLGLED
jgi:hypothetical protein